VLRAAAIQQDSNRHANEMNAEQHRQTVSEQSIRDIPYHSIIGDPGRVDSPNSSKDVIAHCSRIWTALNPKKLWRRVTARIRIQTAWSRSPEFSSSTSEPKADKERKRRILFPTIALGAPFFHVCAIDSPIRDALNGDRV
jgi:hypothetical protein